MENTEKKIYSRTTTIQEDKVSGFCPGCMHITVVKLIGEVLAGEAGHGFDFNVIEHQYIFGLGNNPKVVSKEDIEELIYNSHFENGVESVDSVSIRR